MRAIGLDLAGTQTNPTGFASLSDRVFQTRLVHLDAEILELCIRNSPGVVAIDAPLSLPSRGNLRQADALLISRGFRVFPPTFAGMKALTARGIRIAAAIRARGIQVIEIHPRTSGMALFGKPDRRAWVMGLRRKGWSIDPDASDHEIDAAIAALTGFLWKEGRSQEVGDPSEGTIIIPLGRL